MQRNGFDRISKAAALIAAGAMLSPRAALAATDTALLPVNLREASAIAVAFEAGYGVDPADVPAAIRGAILNLAAHLYEARGDARPTPPDIAAELAPFKVMML